MRKQTKLVAVLSAAALLAIGASMTSFAATGWTEENGTWVYYDKDGYKVTDTWKKSGANWYYLDEDGNMAISKKIDSDSYYYYVDETGKMVTNQWVEMENENYIDSSDDEEPETVWYYFQSSGKAYRGESSTSFKTINGKRYAFDSEGRMLFGWVNETSQRISGNDAYMTGLYYCGDSNDGARVTGEWRNLYVSDKGPAMLDDAEYAWFYFQSSGKKAANLDTTKPCEQKKINGKYYAFDTEGVMISEWYDDVKLNSKSTASEVTGYYHTQDDGSRAKGWFKTVASENYNPGKFADDSAQWFYANSDGTLVGMQVKTINGKKYGFDEKGAMMSGVVALNLNADNAVLAYEKIGDEKEVKDNDALYNTVQAVAPTAHVYYFGGSEDGSMKTGSQNIDIDGTTYAFSFGKSGSNKGQGLEGIQDGKTLYVYGKKVKADSDYKYQAVDMTNGKVVRIPLGTTSGIDTGLRLVNTSGTIMKSTTSSYKDADGNIYKVNADGTIKSYEAGK